MAKEIFEEKQRFNQWWIWLISLVVILASSKSLWTTEAVQLKDIISPMMAVLIISFVMFGIVLKTRIDEKGVHIRMLPFHLSEVHYSWEDIESIEATEYSPLFDYGGWGIRGFGDNRAFNISGNEGIRIKLKNGKTRMIGTQKTDQVKKIIEQNFS